MHKCLSLRFLALPTEPWTSDFEATGRNRTVNLFASCVRFLEDEPSNNQIELGSKWIQKLRIAKRDGPDRECLASSHQSCSKSSRTNGKHWKVDRLRHHSDEMLKTTVSQ